ncbi:MAG: ABC transporter substrate-binding protein [Candidatus Hydrothermarchaeota archaeon]
MRRSVKGFLLVIIISTVLFSGCTAKPPEKPEKVKVRLGYLTADLHQLAYYVAKKKGWYEEAGIEVIPVEYINGAFEMDGFKANEIDVGYLGTAPATIKHANLDIPIQILAQVNNEGSAIVVGKDKGIKSVKDLKGKNIGIPGPGTVQHFLLLKALSQVGLESKDVSLVYPMPGKSMLDNLKTGTIDAFVGWEPFNAAAVEGGYGEILITSHEIWPSHPCCVLATRMDFKRNNPETIQKLVDIHVRATKWIKENPEEAVRYGVEFTGRSEEAVRLAMKNIDFAYEPNEEGTKTYLTELLEFGIIKQEKVPDKDQFIRDFFDKSFVEKTS